MGAIMILLFSILFLKDLKKNFYSKDNINILLYVIISTYFLTISYSIQGWRYFTKICYLHITSDNNLDFSQNYIN